MNPNETDASGVTVSRERMDTMLDSLASANRTARATYREVVALKHLILFAIVVGGAVYLNRSPRA